MKLLWQISLVIGALGAAVLLCGLWGPPLADWIVRAAGALTLAALFTAVFTGVKLRQRKAGARQTEK